MWSPLSYYGAGVSACDRGNQWQRALVLLSEMREAGLEADGITCSAGISACANGEQWQPALVLLSAMQDAKMEPDTINSATVLSSARATWASSGSGPWRF
ncbi:unnamed protein product [Prorocentrum cordatum]|uniref:Uncharacterized protein n=1 Tax=Prorocentrum cordatum TaxID=2364126 RepID=A0ABN9UU13_9DINO|nr:unnamed protein product [Polarella glacialis]